jgi:hypothetical protein
MSREIIEPAYQRGLELSSDKADQGGAEGGEHAAGKLKQSPLHRLEASFKPIEALVDPIEAAVDLVETLVDPVEALVDLAEALVHLAAQIADVCIYPSEAFILAVVEVVQALVGPTRSHSLHDATLRRVDAPVARRMQQVRAVSFTRRDSLS